MSLRLFRLSNYADLSGFGGTLAPGRWHSFQYPIVYTAEHAALALLEAHVQATATVDLPRTYQLLVIETDLPPPSFAEPPATLNIADHTATRLWGDAWLADAETPLARVRSVIAPYSFNILLNPAHPDAARVRMLSATRHPWDPRMVERRSGPH